MYTFAFYPCIFYFFMLLLVFGFYRLCNKILNIISFSNVNIIWKLQVSFMCTSSQHPPGSCPSCAFCPQVRHCSRAPGLQCHPGGNPHGCLFRQGKLFLVAIIPCICYVHDLVSCTWFSKCLFEKCIGEEGNGGSYYLGSTEFLFCKMKNVL